MHNMRNPSNNCVRIIVSVLTKHQAAAQSQRPRQTAAAATAACIDFTFVLNGLLLIKHIGNAPHG